MPCNLFGGDNIKISIYSYFGWIFEEEKINVLSIVIQQINIFI